MNEYFVDLGCSRYDLKHDDQGGSVAHDTAAQTNACAPHNQPFHNTSAEYMHQLWMTHKFYES